MANSGLALIPVPCLVQYLPSWFIGMGAKKAALRGNILRQEVSNLLFERLRHSGVS